MLSNYRILDLNSPIIQIKFELNELCCLCANHLFDNMCNGNVNRILINIVKSI